jgi:hypothetical protein
MQNCSSIRKSRKRGPAVWLLRRSDKSISGKRIYRKPEIENSALPNWGAKGAHFGIPFAPQLNSAYSK